MQTRSQSSPARLAAVIALVVAAIAFAIVIGISLGGDSGDDGGERTETQRQVRLNEEGKPQKRYIVKPGDTLSTIAEEVNVPVEELQRLNPDIDPQTLRSGALVKIR